ncbi:MAG: Molybdopterin-synthase adenylyltransferase [uncultured Solirubrobacterales bacterium]|uniref:Molybdopterin-synthase adenylyltransferase n=1 Tax=uncultured Solirubrobacterales bacterium TaxID=768556 RepID=A0A6J4SKN9_9ACTN|nr:MAG: Molybdopterin-synthase adenylyltransferase [uncultured Solirubrobacterales bacterium]
MTLSDSELVRYSRQLVMSEWSGAAQGRLRSASAMVIGAGALGSPAATYLAAAGVGRIGVVDDDEVELSNLHRQPLHLTPDMGARKAENAAVKLGFLNPEVVIEPFPARLEAANAEALLAGTDVVVDCSDSFATRYLVNDTCCALGIPLVEAGVLGLAGLVMSIRPGESACYRCAFPVEPEPGSVPSCREAGVLGAVGGIVGSFQALEAIKLLTGVGEPLLDRVLQLDGASAAPMAVTTRRREDCPACGGPAAASVTRAAVEEPV